jgi:hypothetical protein
MSSLAKHLYDKAKGRIQTDLKEIDSGSDTYAACATPPSGKKLAITMITVSPTEVGANGAVTFGIHDSGNSLVKTVFQLLRWTVNSPVQLDLAACPIIMGIDEYLAVKTVADDQQINITTHSFVLD